MARPLIVNPAVAPACSIKTTVPELVTVMWSKAELLFDETEVTHAAFP
jgi:hypothetical protein